MKNVFYQLFDEDLSRVNLMYEKGTPYEAAVTRLVDEEDKKKPLSDQAIADALESQGIKVARRTVAKYREQLGIPIARLRK